MNNSFQAIVGFLFERRPTNSVPQVGMAAADKRALAWIPGKVARSDVLDVRASSVKFLGCTQRCYVEPRLAMDSQDSWLCFAGIDIDASDNPGWAFTTLVIRTAEAIGPEASIRSSCGGRGLHVFLRFSHPIWVGAFPAAGTHTRLLAQVLGPYLSRLEAAGVKVCKSDCRMFWIWGGANTWIQQSDQFVPTATIAPATPEARCPGATPTHNPNLGNFVNGWLQRLGTAPGRVYVGDLVARLRELGEPVTTKSPCSGNGRLNGFIDVGAGWIQLWSYADGHAIWRAEDTESLFLNEQADPELGS